LSKGERRIAAQIPEGEGRGGGSTLVEIMKMSQRTKKKSFQISISGPMIICAGTLVFFSLFAKNFFTVSNGANIIRQASVLALVAFGQTFTILIQG